MKTLGLEQEPLQPTALKIQVRFKRTSLIDPGVECELRTFNQGYSARTPNPTSVDKKGIYLSARGWGRKSGMRFSRVQKMMVSSSRMSWPRIRSSESS